MYILYELSAVYNGVISSACWKQRGSYDHVRCQNVRKSSRRDGDVRTVSLSGQSGPRYEQEPRYTSVYLGTSKALENHALLVMNALDEAITNMDDPEYLIDMLLTTGKSHQRFENFSMQIFWV